MAVTAISVSDVSEHQAALITGACGSGKSAGVGSPKPGVREPQRGDSGVDYAFSAVGGNMHWITFGHAYFQLKTRLPVEILLFSKLHAGRPETDRAKYFLCAAHSCPTGNTKLFGGLSHRPYFMHSRTHLG